jgi:hypothetical protein
VKDDKNAYLYKEQKIRNDELVKASKSKDEEHKQELLSKDKELLQSSAALKAQIDRHKMKAILQKQRNESRL